MITELTPNSFNEFMKDIFAPPPKGTYRTILFEGYSWRFKQGTFRSLEILDGETWREPNEEEMKIINKLINNNGRS
jgi:hypothetical protein